MIFGDFRWFSDIFLNTVVRGFWLFWYFWGFLEYLFDVFFRFPLDKSWHFNFQKKIILILGSYGIKKDRYFVYFWWKSHKKATHWKCENTFFFFSSFFQQLTSSGISIKTFKKERIFFIFFCKIQTLLEKSPCYTIVLCWKNHEKWLSFIAVAS